MVFKLFNIFLFLLLTLLIGVGSRPLYAQGLASSSQMITLSLKNINIQNNTVSGVVTITNNSNSNFAESYLTSRLISPEEPKVLTTNDQKITLYEPGQLIEIKNSDFFSLKPGDKLDQLVSLKYPTSINSGKYALLVEIKDKDNSSQGITSQQVDLSGTGTFLEIAQENCQIRVGDKTFGVTEGPNVAKNETATLNCTLKNTSSQTVRAKPQVEYAINLLGKLSLLICLIFLPKFPWVRGSPGQLKLISQIICRHKSTRGFFTLLMRQASRYRPTYLSGG